MSSEHHNTAAPGLLSTTDNDSEAHSCSHSRSETQSLFNSYGAVKPNQVTLIVLISYTIVGILVYHVLCALAEVASPGPSTVADHAAKFCDPSLGFTIEWIYWLKLLVVTPNQLTAAALVVSYWLDADIVNPGIWITVFMLIILGVDYWGGRFMSQYEFILSSFKITVVLALMVFSLVLALGGGPDHDRIGFRYWETPRAFAGDHTATGILRAICRTMPSATFAYLGSELIGINILRTRNTRKTALHATKLTFYRILVINIVTVTFIGMLVPFDAKELEFARVKTSSRLYARATFPGDKQPTASSAAAFVVAVQIAHIAVMPHILNACFLLFILSAANHSLYMATRTLYGLSLSRKAFAFLSHLDRRGTPIYTLFVCSAVASLAYLNIQEDSKCLFNHFVNLITMFSILTWISILVVHLTFARFPKAKAEANPLTFRAPFGVAGSWAALAFCVFITAMRGFDTVDSDGGPNKVDYKAIITSYVGIPLYLLLFIGHKLYIKNRKCQLDIEPIEMVS
ncbi:amino acid permease/ SLC12A domain-containing protein [Aspergillus flavus]|uniref:Amino acid permease/ SLC12A domain-containing protein n=2 Tax=Aspergillus subgen. Circumdati TaxID=2720871 RepID=A0A5N6HA78_ASPFL|nr:amino acid transporter [Aspergillus oryzae 3.042]KAB8250110.1 amino acid permease/ SLC12A domain-containing protein [Aspergillus flavus]KDE85374.1 amino acid transporter [Aspergillus oryzae 100-8]|eukprot:EIT76366.1 amino acid transporter [Aspergillus oryzae 3.042]